MYLEGVGFGATGRLLPISYGTVYAWVKAWGSEVDLPGKKEEVAFMELDEMHTYVGSKNTIVGSGLPLTDLESGLSVLSAGIVPPKQDSGFGKKITVESGIIWQDSNERESATAKLNT
ncbi:hypothetical protein EZS27_011508 [termite gut metagenome]|uniref:Uncharacterized protein n=1 Tax=termite gut metagenome TaxID=433724 RepID=A0A5J4S4J8_9ZZZZ